MAVERTAFATALRAASQPTALEPSKSCEVADQEYKDQRASWKRLNNLVYLLAAATVLFLLGGVVLVAIGSGTRGAGLVSFVGTAVTGVGAGFVVKNRNQAQKEKLAAAALVKDYCGDTAARKLDPKDHRQLAAN